MHDTAGMRERLFTMRMSDEESQRLEAVAKHYALNAAGVIRMLVKREFDAIIASNPEKPKKKSNR
jgi:predicted DNA-binding protein